LVRILLSLSLLPLLLLLSGYPVFGMLFEIFGILNLFGSVACRSLVDGAAVLGCCCLERCVTVVLQWRWLTSYRLLWACPCVLLHVRFSTPPSPRSSSPLRSNFFPIILSIFRNLPVIGPLLNLPLVQRITDKLMGATLPTHMNSA